MIELTVQQAIDLIEGKHPDGHYVYLYRDQETNLYVGRSVDPIKRLGQHLLDHSSIARVIKANRPESLNWSMVLFSLEECAPIVQQVSPIFYDHYTSVLEIIKPYGTLYDQGLVEVAERALIDHFQPCLNFMDAGYINDLPSKYRKSEFAETESSSMYLDL